LTGLRAEELDHAELLELDPDSGIVRFAGERALLLDAVAMGLLRRSLVDGFGLTAARTLLTQFGFAHGWRMAEGLGRQFEWDSDDEWRRAGPRIYTLEGLFSMQGGSRDPLSAEGATIVASYEAEQHLLHLGRSDAVACWTICGLLSGYISRIVGDEVYVLEDRCMAKGDAACHLVGRTRDAWGDERADEARYFAHRPITDSLEGSLRTAIEGLKEAEAKLALQRRAFVEVAPEHVGPHGIVSKSRVMQRLVDLTRRVAAVDSTVIITGESGVGKERIARLVHDESPRASKPFVDVSCGAIAETLLESELFGHAKGAFTGAVHARPGLFEAANGGTILLDEIGEISPGMQVKLLRALQEREIRRVGENVNRPIDVRVIAATHRDLARGVAEGTFRQDLYYRLRVVELNVPPLRERRGDLLALARVLLGEAAYRTKRNIEGFTPEVADRLVRYPWPGNVRELENAMERAVVLAKGTRVAFEDLPPEIRDATLDVPNVADGIRPLADVEKRYILAALDANGGNQTLTAKDLGISKATLYRRLKSYGLTKDRLPGGEA